MVSFPLSMLFDFPLQTPPDISKDTRIISICAIPLGRNLAQDKWYHAQFYFFMALFKGLGVKQEWCTSIRPEDLVKDFRELTYQDRKGNRKVVLDAAMLGPDLMCNITLVESSRLLNSLKRMLNYDCGRLASIFHNPVILMVFGHGCMKAAGMNFGSEYFTVQNMVEWSGGTKDICLITPNAFAGPDSGWIATPNLNWAMVPSSAMTGREESWDAGRRISRACEAAFLDEILASESFTPLIKINHSDGIGKRWDERKRLVDAVHAAFVGGGAGSAGGISFDFKTDRWEIDYKTRQGLPLILFQRRWDALRTSPPVGTVSSIVSVSKPTGNDKSFAVSPGDTVFDIGPNPVSASKIAEGDTLDNSFAVQETYRSMLLPIIHANSIFNDSSPIHENYLLSLLMYRINDDPRPSLAWLRQVASILSFRISVAELADRYATLVGFAWPGCRCANFPLQRWYKSLSKGQEEEFWRIFDKLSDKALFPGPQKMLQGDPTKKPIGYLAMVLMKKNVTEKKMDEFIGHMMSYRNCRLKRDAMRIVETDEAVIEAKKRLEEMGTDLGL